MMKSQFSLEAHGVKADPAKERRWCDERKIDFHKNVNGYVFTRPEGTKGKPTDKPYVKYRGMVLMERSSDKADEVAKEKAQRAANQRSAVRVALDNDLERLSSKHGRDLHQYVTNEEGDDE